MEYRYDGARSRYRVQQRDPRKTLPNGQLNDHFLYPYDPSLSSPACWSGTTGRWSDYDGSSIHDDFALAWEQPPDAEPMLMQPTTMQHEPGLGQYEPGAGSIGVPPVNYYHSNLIGTTEAMTGPPAGGTGVPPVTRRTIYTAFGEPVYSGLTPQDSGLVRFGYAGAFGYQEGTSNDPLAALGWLHVGHRYYDPACGRFMQRDPIGIRGGLNTYAYCGNRPTSCVDPYGLWTFGFEIEINLAALIGIKLQISAHIGYSEKKGLSAGGNIGGGVTFGPQAGAAASWSCIGSNAQSVADLGNGITGEIDLNAGPLGGLEVGVGRNDDGTPWTSVGVSPPIVGGIGGMYGAGGGAVIGLSVSGSPRPSNTQNDPSYWPG